MRLNLDRTTLFTQTLTPVSVTGSSSASQNFTVAGLKVGDIILSAIPLAVDAGVLVTGGIVVTANTMPLTFINAGSTGTPASQKYTILVVRPDERATLSPNFI